MVFTKFWHFEGHGKHIYSSRILEAWVESYILDQKAEEKAFAGKSHWASKHSQANTAGYVAHFNDFIGEKKNSFKKMLAKVCKEMIC